jgi:hypothetical protein
VLIGNALTCVNGGTAATPPPPAGRQPRMQNCFQCWCALAVVQPFTAAESSSHANFSLAAARRVGTCSLGTYH